MKTIKDFLGKWGDFILIALMLMVFFSTCGSKSKIDRLDKKVNNLESTISYNDSLTNEINIIEREISNLEVSRNVVYDNNAIVRTTKRPDDVMNEYDQRIKALQEKLTLTKNARK